MPTTTRPLSHRGCMGMIRYLGLMTYVEEPWLLPDDFSLLVLIHEAVMERRAEIPDRLFEFLDWKIAHKEW